MRKNKKFPNYKPVPFDPSTPPEGYWNMSSKKCKECGTQWPGYAEWSVSPCCLAGTINTSTPPSMSWNSAVEALKTALFEQLYDKWNEDVNDEQLSWLGEPQPINPSDLDDGLVEIDRIIEDVAKSLSDS